MKLPIISSIKKLFEKKDKKIPIKDIIVTKYPGAYADYYELMGYSVTTIPSRDGKTYIIVWEAGVKEKEKTEVLTKLKEVI